MKRRVFRSSLVAVLWVWGACSAQKASKTTIVAVVGPQTVTCSAERRLCLREQLQPDGTVGCAEYNTEKQYFRATVCTLDATETPQQACDRAFCTRATANPTVSYDYLECLTSGGIDQPAAGLCQPLPAGSQRASLIYTRNGRRCVPDPTGQFCATFTAYVMDDTKSCFDLSERTAVDQLTMPTDARDPRLWIQRIVPNAPACNGPAPSSQSALSYNLGATTVGSVSAAGTSVPVKITQGTARVLRTCTNGACQPTSLASLNARLADTTVAGVPLTNLSLRVRGDTAVGSLPDPDGTRPGFPSGTLSFAVEGLVAGVPSRYVVANDSAFIFDATSSALALRGTFHLQDVDARGRPLTAELALSLDGSPVTGPGSDCGAQTSLQRLFGFETSGDWTSSQASLSTVTTPLTQGCGALAIAGQNYIPITGRPFANTALNVQGAVSVDLFVPSSQPNPYWTGALQLYLTCPSRSYFNQFIGQVELTAKRQNTYNTLRFPLPQTAQDALRQASNDCFWSFALNVNPTGRTWVLDNLRLSP